MSFRVSDLVAQGIIQGDSAYATIFYDSANTGYYLDPASTSNIYQLRAGAGNASPYSTTFSHTLAGVGGSNRVVNFDGNGSAPSVWWSNGGTAIGAIDAISGGGLSFWSNNGSSWQQQISMTYGTVNVLTTLQQGGSQVATQSWVTSQGYVTGGPYLPLSGGTLTGTLTVNSGYNTGSPLYVYGATSGNDAVITVQRGSGSHKGSGLYISGANYTDVGNQAFIELNANTYSGSSTRYIHAYDNSGTDFVVYGDGVVTTSGSFRAPIFYDSQDTNYFGDFAGRSMMNKIEVSRNGSYGSYLDADLIVGSGAHDRRGYGQTGGSNIMLRSSAKSTITALDESQNLGQISYENLVWTIGEDIGWGNQKAYFPGDVGVGVSPISKLHVQAAVPSGVGGSPAGTIITVDNSGNNFITFRHSADNGTYAGLAFLDNNIGGYVVFGNSGANPSDSMAIAGYNGGVLQYGAANSVNPAARTTVVSWNSTGLQVNNGDLRASIFYDINDTSYYVDPNSTSRLNILTTAYLNGHYTNTSAYNSSNTLIATPSGIRSQAAFITFTDGNAIAPYAMYRTSGDWPAPYGIGWGTGGESSGIFQQYASNNYSLGDMTFYINNDGAGRFKWVMGGWEGTTYNPSGSNNYNNAVMTLDNSGNLQASASMRAPIFYDSNDTNYYLDPASTSNLNGLTVGGSSVVTNNGATWGISINGNAATATTASNANALGGNGPSYYYPANTPNGYAAGDINGNTTHQRLWGTDSVQNLLAFRPPTSIEYSTNGSTWVSTSATDGLWDNKIFGKWGGFNMNVGNNIGGWRYVRMTWVNFGYHFFSNFTLAHSTNGHSFNFVFYKSDLNGNFGAEAFRMNGISSWPGYTFVKYSDVSGWWDTRDVRMVFELNYNSTYPDNAISIGHIGLMGSYSGFTRLYDWDGSRNMYFANNATASASFRAPIFYDSDNTSYYLDPASGSNLNSVVTVETKARKNQTAGNYSTAALWTESYGNTATGIAFHISGNVGKFLEMRTDGILYWNNDTVMHSGNSTYAWNMNQYVRTTDTVSFRNLQSAYQVLNLDTQKAPGLYNYDGGIGGTQPLGTNWYNVRTIEIGDSSRYSQFVMPYADTRIFYRINQGSWQPYVELLHSSNYSSFSLPLSGGSMSGDIVFPNNSSVALRNTAQDAGFRPDDIYGNMYLWNYSGGFYVDANSYYFRNTAGSVQWMSITGSGTVQANSDFRAPIFYDSQNTSYYLDPNSTTSIRTVGSWRSDSSAWDGEFSGKIQYHSNHWYVQGADLFIYRNSGGSNVFTVTQGGNGTFSGSVQTGGQIYINNGDPTIFLQDSDHRSSMIHCNSNRFYILRGSGTNSTGWSTYNGYWPLEIHLEDNNATFGGTVSAPVGDFRAPIFYDSNDTTYYLDPNAGSALKYLRVNGDWGSSPFGSGHETLTVTGSYASICQRSTVGAQAYVLHHVDDKWSLYIGRGSTNGNSWDWAIRAYPTQDGNHVEFRTSARAPIFYDSNNTNYYGDFASTSRMAYVTMDQSTGAHNHMTYGGYWSGGDWQTLTNTEGQLNVVQVNNINAGGYSNQPPNVYTYGGVLSWRTSNHSFQLYASHTGDITFKTQWNNDNYSGWRRIIHESNISSFALAYGNLTGSFGMNDNKLYLRTNGDTNHYLWNADDDYEELRAYAGTGFRVRSSGGEDLLLVYGASNGGYTYSPYSFRAPIFYDSQDTTYYLDPNSLSNLRNITVNHTYGSSILENGHGLVINGNYTNGQYSHRFRKWDDGGGVPLYMQFTSGTANSWSNLVRFGPWSSDSSYFRVFGSILADSNIISTSDMRAPIFYDYNDTTYYADFANSGRSMYTAGYLQSDRMIMKGSSGGGQIYPTIAYGGMSMYGGDSLTNGAWITVTGISYGSSPGAGSAEIIVRSEASSKIAMYSYNGSTYTGRAALWGSNGNFVIGSATTDYGYKLYVDGTIYATGNVIAYSDESVKTNVREIENPLARVLNTRGVIYDRIDNEDKDNIGFIAQELEKEFPELVSTGNNGKKGVMYQNMVAVLIEAMKEQNKEIQKLKMLINGASR